MQHNWAAGIVIALLLCSGILAQQREDQQASEDFLKPTRVSLHGTMEIGEALDALGKQAGIEIEGSSGVHGEVQLEIKDLEFWRAADQILAGTAARLIPHKSDGTPALQAIQYLEAGPGASPPIADYDGPFRVEAIRCQSTKSYRLPDVSQTRVVLNIQWEPRLRPIALQQPMNEIAAIGEPGGVAIVPRNPDIVQDSVIQRDAFPEMSLQFSLPRLETTRISKLSGTMYAIVPGPTQKFQFEDLDEDSQGSELRKGRLKVRFEGWAVEDANYAVHLRLIYDRDFGALDSFRQWIADNAIELNDGMGTSYKPLRVDVLKQSGGEVALKFLFSNDPTSLSLEYWTASDIFKVPIKYELKDLILP